MSAIDVYALVPKLRARGESIRSVAKLLNVSSTTVARWSARPGPRNRTKTAKKASICPEKKAMLQRLLKVVNKKGEQVYPSLRLLSRAARERGVNIGTANTVRRLLHRLHFTCRARPRTVWRKPEDAPRRLKFAREELRLGAGALRTRLFSDEKIFDCAVPTSRKAWVRKGSRPRPRREERWSPSVHAWAVIGIDVRCIIFFESGSVTKERYIAEVLKPALPIISAPGVTFMQDGARAHTAAQTLTYLERRGVKWLRNWPARSPDLNPIENVWGILQRRVATCGPTTREELKQFVEREFLAIPAEEINRTAGSYGAKLKRCVKNAGR